MSLAEKITAEMAARYTLPNDLLACIFYSIEKDEQSEIARYSRYTFAYSPALLESCISRSLHQVFSRLPPIKAYNPHKPHATIYELADLKDVYEGMLERYDLPMEYNKDGIPTFLGHLPYTCLSNVASFNVGYEIPEHLRWESTHVLSPPGGGKTQLLQSLLLKDLDTDCSIVVIDSQADLINNIKRLRRIPKERLVIVDPTDVAFPVALNVFDIGQDRIARYSPLEYERHINGVIELLSYVFSSVMGAELTSKQSVPLNYALRLLIHVPGATIHTLCEVFEKNGIAKFQDHVGKLSLSAQRFFATQFNDKAYDETKGQVLRRLSGLLENPTMERLFTNPRSRLNIKDEMDAGKVILINTSKDLLKSGSTFLGRFFFSLIGQAALERASQHPSRRKPTHVYVDECADYIDTSFGTLLDQIRKYKVSLTLSHQHLSQIPQEVRSSVSNTAIKYIGNVSSSDARALADDMHTEWEALHRQKKLHFTLFVRGFLKSPLTHAVTPGLMEKEPQRTEREMQELVDYTRARYSSTRPLQPPPKAPEAPPRPVSRGIVEKPRRTPDPRFTEQKKPDVPNDDIESFRRS